MKISSFIILSFFFFINSFYAQSNYLKENSKQVNAINPPTFSQQGGFYNSQFNLILSASNIYDTVYYSLDGSEPTRNSNKYSVPLLIKSRIGDPNFFSIIPTNYVQTGLWAFTQPAGEVFKSTIVKAKSFSGNNAPSATITNTYFVDNSMIGRYDMPVISLTTNAKNLFSDSIGIYVPGIHYAVGDDGTGNYFQTGSLWERPAHIEYFSTTGNKEMEQDVNIRIHGGDTRLLPQKALRLYADTFFNFKFFPHKNITSFKTIMLRNSGNDNISTMFRDAFMSDMLPEMGSGLEYQAYAPAVLFIDGEFWGIHNIRERIDKYFINENCSVNPDSIDLLEKHGIVDEGDNLNYFLWYNFLDGADMTIAANYDYMASLIDINNFTDYNIAQIFFSNIDWPSNNRDYWRPKTQGGKWRWVTYDTDFGFGLENYSDYDNNTLVFATTPNGPTSPPTWNTNYPFATMQLRKMLENARFRNDFVNRFADMLNTTFSTARVINKINNFQTQYSHVMPEHIDRWSKPASYNDWIDNVQHLRNFAFNRPHYMRRYIIEYFNEIETLSQNITDTSYVTLNTPDTTMGYIKISTVRPITYPWTGIYFHDVPIPLKAKAKPGYKFVEWAGTGSTNPDIEINLLSDTSFTAIFEIDTNYVPHLVFINELMASNSSTIADEFGEYDDWIELYNPNADTVDIRGLFITDDFSIPKKHQIPSNTNITKIPPLGYLLLWADGTPAQGPLHLNFKLSASGEAVGIYDTSLTVIDTVRFGIQTNNVSYGRFPDGNSYWRLFGNPTPGASNNNNSVNDFEINSRLYIYPNPPDDDFINLSKEVKNLELYNCFGQKILALENVQRVDIHHLSKGIYFARINNFFTVKLIIP